MSLLAKPGLSVIKAYIQKELGYKITWYNMILNILQNSIFFEVPSPIVPGSPEPPRRYPYTDKLGVMKLIKTMTQKQLTTGDTIDVIKIEYRPDVIQIGVYYEDSNKVKQSKTITL